MPLHFLHANFEEKRAKLIFKEKMYVHFGLFYIPETGIFIFSKRAIFPKILFFSTGGVWLFIEFSFDFSSNQAQLCDKCLLAGHPEVPNLTENYIDLFDLLHST